MNDAKGGPATVTSGGGADALAADATGNAPASDDSRQLAASMQCPFVAELDSQQASKIFVERFEISYARRHLVLGLAGGDADSPNQSNTPPSDTLPSDTLPSDTVPSDTLPSNTIRVAACDAGGLGQLDTIARVLRQPVEPLLTTEASLREAINAAYQQRSGQTQELIDSLDQNAVLSEIRRLDGREDLLDTSGRSPIIKLVNLILFEAVKAGGSDVHVQPYEDRVVIRQRIDGVLFDSFDVPKKLQEEVLTRIKVLGGMNIAEKRLPQDGRATVHVGDRVVDLRIASLPTSHNERIVIRLLDKSARLYTLGELGMPKRTLDGFRQLIQLDHGLFLVTGPTGSGKSTTLYAALQEINTIDQNVLTLEDPIEYQLNGVSQTQINEKKGLTFASGLRSVLRQDPDIIMVGEIRDHETAVMAIQASLTGHLVFSTLHTNDAASAVTRLLDLGIEPYLVSSSTEAVLAQRLVRKICEGCKQPSDAQLARRQLASLNPELVGSTLYEGRGCDDCRGTGFRGRVGIFELLVLNDRCREIVQARGNATDVRQAALAAGMRLLFDDGIERAVAGMTTIPEVLRVARPKEALGPPP